MIKSHLVYIFFKDYYIDGMYHYYLSNMFR